MSNLTNNKELKFKYSKRGLQVFIYSKKNNAQKCRIIASPEFIELLNIITDTSDKNNFDYELWGKLSQMEKNFMYKLDQLCIPEEQKNIKFENAHLKDSQNLINRLKLLEGTISAGNDGKQVIDESINIINELVDRHQISKLVGTKMTNTLKNWLKSSST
jgi:hypothetical protein